MREKDCCSMWFSKIKAVLHEKLKDDSIIVLAVDNVRKQGVDASGFIIYYF